MKHCEDAAVANLDSTEVSQPGDDALDFPALSVATQLAFALKSAIADVFSVGDSSTLSHAV